MPAGVLILLGLAALLVVLLATELLISAWKVYHRRGPLPLPGLRRRPGLHL